MMPLVLTALLSLSSGQVTVERRLLVKEHHAALVVGPTYLSRADHFLSPGAMASAAWYFSEDDGLELRLGWFFSSMDPAAQEVVAQTGLSLDARRPMGLALLGYRRSLGYGKLLAFGHIFHFDVQAAAHGGALLTDGGPSPMLSVEPAFVVQLNRWLIGQFELAGSLSLEQRRVPTVVPALQPTLSLGVLL